MADYIRDATDATLLRYYNAGKASPPGSPAHGLSDDAADELRRRQSPLLAEVDTQEMPQVGQEESE